MQCSKMGLLEALQFVREKRPVCSPNEGFMQVLVDLEMEIFAAASLNIAQYRQDRYSSGEELALHCCSSSQRQQQGASKQGASL